MKHLARILPLLSLTVVVSHAADEPFKADAELGILLTSGNTKSSSLKARLDAKQNLAAWRLNYIFDALYKEDTVEVIDSVEESQTTAEKYAFSVQADYKLNEEHRAWFLFGSYEEDRFSGYDYQATVATGYTDRFFQRDNTEFTYSIGLGSTFNRTDDFYEGGVLVTEGESDHSAIVRAALDYVYEFSDTAKFTQLLSSDIAPDSDANTKTKSESAIRVNINESLALKAALSVTHNSEVRADIENTDTQTSVTIVYTF